jgi:hypothetical protein
MPLPSKTADPSLSPDWDLIFRSFNSESRAHYPSSDLPKRACKRHQVRRGEWKNDGLAPVETDPEEERIFKSYDVVRKCKIANTYVEGLSDPNPEEQKHERSYDQHHRY